MKRINFRKGWWVVIPAAMTSLLIPFITSVQAAPVPGLAVTVYNNYGYNGSPPLPAVSGRPVQCTTTYDVIDQNFGGNICGLYDDYIVKYEGYITSPTTQTITFYPSADDGTKLYIDGTLIDNNWFDKGGGGNLSTPVSFTAGVPKPITLWFYENGGGNWVTLAWNQSGSYQTVPADAFTQNDETSYTTTTSTVPPTTTLAPYFNEVQNLTAVANEDGSVFLDWDAPVASNTAPYMYGVSFYDLVDGQESGGWGVWTYAVNTSYTLSTGMFSGSNPVTTGYGPVRFKIKAGTGPCVGEGAGDCLYGPEASVDATVLDPSPPTTTTSSTTTTTVSQTTSTSSSTTSTTTIPETTSSTSTTTTTTLPPETTTTTVYVPSVTTTTEPEIEPEPIETEPIETEPVETEPVETDPIETEPIETEPVETEPIETEPIEEPEVELPEVIISPEETVTPENFETIIDSITDGDIESEDIAEFVDNLSDEQIENLFEELDTEQAVEVLEELTTEQLVEVLENISVEVIANAISDLSDDVINDVIDNIEPDALAEVIEELNEEETATLVESIDSKEGLEKVAEAISDSDEPIEATVATAIILNESFDEVSTETAAAVFENIDAGSFSEEQKDEISEALTEAPEEIKEVFEEEINIYGDGFDEYTPVGSVIDVGTRKTVVAAVAALTATIAVAGASPAPSAPSGGSPSGSGGSGSSSNSSSGGEARSRKEEESGEPAGEIAGPEGGDDNNYAHNSIFKYYIKEGIEMKKFNWFGFSKKLWDITAGLAFTLAGSFVVYITLSGTTQRLAGIATLIALFVHYLNEILKNDTE